MGPRAAVAPMSRDDEEALALDFQREVFVEVESFAFFEQQPLPPASSSPPFLLFSALFFFVFRLLYRRRRRRPPPQSCRTRGRRARAPQGRQRLSPPSRSPARRSSSRGASTTSSPMHGPARGNAATRQGGNPEQIEALRSAVNELGTSDWSSVAARVPGRSSLQCQQRWTAVMAPDIVKGPWSPEEDELLARLVRENDLEPSCKGRWKRISRNMAGRTAKQCREHWIYNLDPSISKEPWTPLEDDLILRVQSQLGNKWFPHREHAARAHRKLGQEPLPFA